MLLTAGADNGGARAPEAALSSMESEGFRPGQQGERATINGLDAFIGLYRGVIEGLGEAATRVAHIAHGGSVYMVTGFVPPAAFEQAEPAFTSSIRSCGRLTAAEAEGVPPSRIELYVVRAGDTWASPVGRSDGAIRPATLAIMNNVAADTQPVVGARVKIVVVG